MIQLEKIRLDERIINDIISWLKQFRCKCSWEINKKPAIRPNNTAM